MTILRLCADPHSAMYLDMRLQMSLFTRCIAALAIALQLALPAGAVMRTGGAVDVSQLLCVIPGTTIDDRAEAMLADLAAVLNDSEPPTHEGSSCPLCTLAYGAPLPDPTAFSEPARYDEAPFSDTYQPGLVHKANAPPVGSRGPPPSI